MIFYRKIEINKTHFAARAHVYYTFAERRWRTTPIRDTQYKSVASAIDTNTHTYRVRKSFRRTCWTGRHRAHVLYATSRFLSVGEKERKERDKNGPGIITIIIIKTTNERTNEGRILYSSSVAVAGSRARGLVQRDEIIKSNALAFLRARSFVRVRGRTTIKYIDKSVQRILYGLCAWPVVK